MPKKWYKREICFETQKELEDYDNLIKNLKNKTGENSGKIVMGAVALFNLKVKESLK